MLIKVFKGWLINLSFKTAPTPPAGAAISSAAITALTNINLCFLITYLYTIFLPHQDSYCALK